MPPLRAALAALFLSVALSACGGGAVRTDRVRIYDDAGKPESQWGYAPPIIEVARGAAVTFTNGGGEFHTVTSDDPARSFDVGVDVGASSTIVFDTPGVWSYHCGVHPAMKGVVRVCEGSCG